MRKIIHIIILLSFLFISGCNQEDDMNKEIETKALNVAIEYIKMEENKDLIVTDVQFADADGVETVFVKGYIKGEEENKMFVTVHYGDDYRVSGVGEGVEE